MPVRGYNLSHLIKSWDLILCPGNIEPSSKWLNCDKLIINFIIWQNIMLILTRFRVLCSWMHNCTEADWRAQLAPGPQVRLYTITAEDHDPINSKFWLYTTHQ
jgi:hypothetical protein